MTTRVEFPNGLHSVQPQADAPDAVTGRFQALLKEFHGHRPRPKCGCMYSGRPLELVIRRLRNGRFILARLPNEGASHREACEFHSADVDHSGRAGYVTGVIKETADGGYTVRLNLGLAIDDSSPAPAPEASRCGRPGAARQRAMTPLGLLHSLWEEAQLNRWHPGFEGRRSSGLVAWRLSTAADQFRVGRSELSDFFTAIAPDRRAGAARLADLTREFEGRRRLIVVGAVAAITSGKYDRYDIRLSAASTVALYISALPGQIDTLMAKHPYAARLLAAPPDTRAERVMGLFIVEARMAVSKGKPIVRAALQAGGLLEVSAEFIPVASDLERQVADKLVADGRAFMKPLRYDAEVDLVLPDFVLIDMGVASGWPMEVFGLDNADYRARRAEKETYYRDAYGMTRWWQWVAAGPDRTEMPALPERAPARPA